MHGNPKYTPDIEYLDYANPNAPKHGDIKVAAIGTFDTLNPYSIKGQAPEYMSLVYDRLMRRVWDEPFTMYPLIAERAEVSDDRSEVTFHINPKARFHDGSPITAHDVMYSFETLKELGRPNMRRIYKLVDKAKIKSKHEIYFHFGEGYDRETVMIFALMPVLSKSWWSAHNFDSTITEIPLLNGPYKIKESETGKKIIYERVEDYWASDLLVNKGHYNFNTITYDYFRDDTIALEAFKKGDLDIRREWDIAKWQSAYDNLSHDIIRDQIPHQRPERAHGFIMNLRRAPFDNINVRKALSLAFDEDWVSGNIYHHQFKRVDSFYPNSALAAPSIFEEHTLSMAQKFADTLPSDFYVPDALTQKKSYRDRLQTASQLLEDAGWIVKDGKRVQKDTSSPLTFKLIVSTPQEEKIALTYKRSLKRLGIDLSIRMLDSATFQERKMNYDYDMISFYWQNSLSPGTEQMLYWSCASAKKTAQFNFSGICNPALDHFSSSIANAQTYDELLSYAHIIDRILYSSYIMVPLFYNGADYIAYNKNIHHPEKPPLYGAVVETWWSNP